MKKLFTLLLLALLPLVASSETKIEIGGICFILSSGDTNTASVTSKSSDKYSGDVVIPESVTYQEVTYSVTSIAESAFKGCDGLKSVSIPDNVTTIGEEAFRLCESLTSATLGTGIKSIPSGLFYKCTSLVSFTVPSTVTAIEKSAFFGCTALASIDLANVSEIKESSFNGCTGLTSLSIPASMTKIADTAFSGCENLKKIKFLCPEIGKWFYGKDFIEEIVIGSDVTTIASSAFQNCNGLKSVSIPDNVTTIGEMAFRQCGSLSSATLGTGITSIPQGLFYSCTSLASFTVPTTVTTIEKSAFYGCTALASIDLANVSEIKESAFNGCTGFTSLTIPASMTKIADTAFSNCENLKKIEFLCPEIGKWFYGKDFIEEIVIGSDVTTIASSAFQNCNGLKSVSIPDNVTTIGEMAFRQCGSLSSATLGTGVTSIPNGLFYNCTSLASFTVPSTVTTIEKSAFYGCTTLASIDLANVSEIKESAFNGCTGLTLITIPASMTKISDTAFSNCKNLKKIEFLCPEIGKWFYGKDFIEEIVIGSGVTTIAESAFYGCDGLKSVYIPSNVTSIGASAFSCESLKEVWTDTPQPLNIASSVFSSTTYNDGVLYVLSKSIDAYKAADSWKDFKTIDSGWFLVTAKANTGGKAEFAGKAVTNDESYSAYVKRGNDTIVTVTPNEGYELKSMTVNDEEKFSEVKDGVLAISNILTNIDAVATFKKLTFKITTTAGEGGKLVPSSEIVEWGDDATVKVTPNEGYQVNTLSVDGNDKIGELKDSILVISSVKADVNVEATFKLVFKSITIGKSGKASYCGDKSLDFSGSEEIKAYIATGFDETEGTIWLTRVKDVPAGTPVLLKGEANKSYPVPVTNTQNSYYKNMFKGNTSGETIQVQETEDGLVNYYLGSDGTFKKVKNYANIGNNKSYLQLPGTFAAPAAGATQTVTIKSSGKASYAAPVDLDFTNVEGLKAFTATGYDKSSKTIWLTRVMKVQKGEGLLLKGEAKTYEIPSEAVQSSYQNMFVGNTSGDQIQVQETSEDGTLTNYYLKGDGTFVSVNGYVNIGNNKCYLALPTEMVAAASTRGEASYLLEEPEVIKMPITFRSLDNDGNGTTGVKEVKSVEVKVEEWFTLQGQRVMNPGKGIYIKNGRKVVIK